MKAAVVLHEILRHCVKAVSLSPFSLSHSLFRRSSCRLRRPVTRAVLLLLSNRAPLPDSQSRVAGRSDLAAIRHVRS